MITKDGRDTPIEKLTPENYIVPRGEEQVYHAVIEVVQYNQKTGERVSKPRVQKFGKKMFETHVLNSLRKQGYTVTILHDPNKWIKEQQEKSAKAKAEQEAAKAKEEEEKFNAAVAAAVAAELAKREQAGKQETESEQEQELETESEQEQSPKRPGRRAKNE
jgi:uncharacterized protein with ATP-grasp and redox domains